MVGHPQCELSKPPMVILMAGTCESNPGYVGQKRSKTDQTDQKVKKGLLQMSCFVDVDIF